ncbi:hypothetical protein Tco_0834085 [Tanacetum coccineum]
MLFDVIKIDDCKAPGPDVYTTCFFKRAWSIVGKDVCLAIKEFFIFRKLLRELNSTLIALIPKVDHPKFVIDFRPIACCNVLYKCISKFLTNILKDSLDKLVNLNQTHKESLWVKWVHMIKLWGKRFWEVDAEYNDSWIRKVLLGVRDKAKKHIEYKVGNGNNNYVWYDKWNDIWPLCQFISRRDIYDARFDNNANVADMIVNNH